MKMNKLVPLAMALSALSAFADMPQVKNVKARQQHPWGKVCISYEVVGDLKRASDNAIPFLVVQANDGGATTNCAIAFSPYLKGDVGTEEGLHRVVWDFDAQGVSFSSTNVSFSVMYRAEVYVVVDLSSGANAASYPVSYLTEAPTDGFNKYEYKSTKLVLRSIVPGRFLMCGTNDVVLTKPYYIGVFEVTQAQYNYVMGENPSENTSIPVQWSGDIVYFSNMSGPVDNVSYSTIRGDSSTYNWPVVVDVSTNSFVGRLRRRTGLNFDLPTEAQWEYACRAGTTSAYNNGGDSEDDLKQVGRYKKNSEVSSFRLFNSTYQVGSYAPNLWGLYDMHGNVGEFCLDWAGDLIGGHDPECVPLGEKRVVRGGDYFSPAYGCTSSYRWQVEPEKASAFFGFRIALVLPK